MPSLPRVASLNPDGWFWLVLSVAFVGLVALTLTG
jgi:hypothetical protein